MNSRSPHRQIGYGGALSVRICRMAGVRFLNLRLLYAI